MTCPIIYEFKKGTPNFFLSNFYLVPITVTLMIPGSEPVTETYDSTEHAFQAAKTYASDEREAFRRPGLSAGMAKKMGQFVTMRKDWNSSKVGVMASLLNIKFANPELREMLLATVPKMLVEGNYWHDIFWGVCFCPKHQGEGLNTLGRLLMNTRSAIQTAPHQNPVVTTATVRA
jgi:ribA/ribD-fused uncharacterized protein